MDALKSCPELQFSVHISRQEWLKLDPQPKTYADNRSYVLFNPGWTTLLNSKIWDATRTPCKFRFRHLKFHTLKGRAAFSFDAACTARTNQEDKKSKCGNVLLAKCIEIPEDLSTNVEVQILMLDTRQIPHFGKRPVHGKARQEEKQNLKNIKAVAYQVKKAANIMNSSDLVPAHLPNLDVLRRMQQETKDESLNLDLYPGDPLTSLSKIMENNNFIQYLSTSPFIVHYITADQIKLLREALAAGYNSLSLDASGFSQKFRILGEETSGAIFMYEISLNIVGKIVSVGSMLSEAHDTINIADWLSRWLDIVEVRPRSMIVDGSLAILNALTLSLYDCSYSDYIDQCFEVLEEFEQTSEVIENKPDVLIFRDRNHIIKNVRNWKCFEKCADWCVKDFYTRIVGYMLTISSLKLFKETVYQVFLVINSDAIEPDSSVDNALNALLSKIETFEPLGAHEDIGGESDKMHYISNIINENLPIYETYRASKFIDDLYNNSLKECLVGSKNFPEPNRFKLPEIADYFKPLFYQFPTFTNCMDQFYENIPTTKTSSSSETRFKILKTDYKLKLMQVQKLLLRHVKFNIGECLMARGELKRQRLVNKNQAEEKKVLNPKKHVHESNVHVRNLKNNNRKCNPDKSREHCFRPAAINETQSEEKDDRQMDIGDFSPPKCEVENTSKAQVVHAVGFPNQGNTCWLNASLHILLSLPVFQNLEKISIARNIESPALFNALIKIQKSLDRGDPLKKISENIKFFRHQLKALNDIDQSENFTSHNQKDVAEFLVLLLEYLNLKFKNFYQSSEVEDVFKRKAVEHYQCSECFEASMKEEESNFIVDVLLPQNNDKKSIDIQEMVMKTFQSDVREKRCESCEFRNNPHTMFLEIKRMPKILIVNIKKYQSGFQTKGQVKKLNCHTKVQERITLGVNELDGLPKDFVYTLKAVICHIGDSAQTGHYTSVVRYSSKYLYFDDDRPVVQKDALNDLGIHIDECAYVLFYELGDQEQFLKNSEENVIDSGPVKSYDVCTMVAMDTFSEGTPQMQKIIDCVQSGGNDTDVVAIVNNNYIRRGNIRNMFDNGWLDDEIINIYMELLIERGKQPNNLKVHAMNSFFYIKLLRDGYIGVKRWTMDVDVFGQDLLLVPIHQGAHWCMAIVDFRKKFITYYDSFGSKNPKCLSTLAEYLMQEHMDKKESHFDLTDWIFEDVPKNAPWQKNAYDCGVFACTFAEFVAANRMITFTQRDMPNLRKKMMYEIITKKLL